MANANEHIHEVYISETAFHSMILSSVEVYKKECLGILLGYRNPKKTIVEYAVPYQSAERLPRSVRISSGRHTRIENFLNMMPKLDIIGDFHSHTMWGKSRARMGPSGDDIDDMVEGNIYIILAINDKTRAHKWTISPRGILSGTIGDYSIRMGGFYIENNDDKRIVRGSIVCPSATGLS